MTNEATTPAAAADTAAPSQIIEHRETAEVPRAPEMPEVELPKESGKAPSTREAIAKAFDEAEKAKKEPEPKEAKAEEPKEPAKTEEPPAKAAKKDQKIAKADDAEAATGEPDPAGDEAAAERAETEARQSEGRRHSEPPARFLPEARTKWANTPNEVKAEVHRVAQEYETELAKAKEVTERYERFRDVDEQLRQSGVDLRQRIDQLNQIGLVMQRNPVLGLEMTLRQMGLTKPDGSPMTLHDVAMMVARQTPEQFNQNMRASMGQVQARPAQQPQQAGDPRVMTELQAVKAELAAVKAQPIIENFRASHPDYPTLEPQIAEILRSGVVEKVYGTGLSPEQRLEQAYRMAGGQHSPSRSEPPAPEANSQAPAARPVDPDGQKSIKGAPTAGTTGNPKWTPKTNREALERAFASTR